MTTEAEQYEMRRDAAEKLVGTGFFDDAEDTPTPTPRAPSDGPVTLPGGFYRYAQGITPEWITAAEVRELRGKDEEKIAKTQLQGSLSGTDITTTILECGVASLGGAKPSRKELENLLLGDREFLLLKISEATYGSEFNWENVSCPFCKETFSFSFDKVEDVPIKTLSGPEARVFDVALRKDRLAQIVLVTGADMKAMEEGKTNSEANSILLDRCIKGIRHKDEPEVEGTMAEGVGADLGISDRKAILDALEKASPGPQYNEISVKHPVCEQEIKVVVTFVDLFPGL